MGFPSSVPSVLLSQLAKVKVQPDSQDFLVTYHWNHQPWGQKWTQRLPGPEIREACRTHQSHIRVGQKKEWLPFLGEWGSGVGTCWPLDTLYLFIGKCRLTQATETEMFV